LSVTTGCNPVIGYQYLGRLDAFLVSVDSDIIEAAVATEIFVNTYQTKTPR